MPRMEIIDAHTHIFPPEMVAARGSLAERDEWFGLLYADPKARMATAEDLVASMDAAGVARSVAFGFAFRDQGLCDACNAYVLEAASRLAPRLIPFAVANPLAGRAASVAVQCALAAGARGIGELMPDGQGFALAEDALLALLLGLTRECGVPVMVHVSELVGHRYPGKGTQGPADACRLATAFPDNRFVLSHWGGGLPFYHLMPDVRAALANVWYDSAASLYLYDDSIFALAECWAPGRTLFGSDYPLIGQQRFLRRIRASGLAEPALSAFLGANTARLLDDHARPSDPQEAQLHG